MKLLMLSVVTAALMATGCTSKVYNQNPPATGAPTIIEHDHDRVVPQPVPTDKPAVENNIHVDQRP
jgi:hypothetical protein